VVDVHDARADIVAVSPSGVRRVLRQAGLLSKWNTKPVDVRLNSATGCITPKDVLLGQRQEIHAERDWRLDTTRKGGRFVGCKPFGLQITCLCCWCGPVRSKLAKDSKGLNCRGRDDHHWPVRACALHSHVRDILFA
jgi:hypothetical protein